MSDTSSRWFSLSEALASVQLCLASYKQGDIIEKVMLKQTQMECSHVVGQDTWCAFCLNGFHFFVSAGDGELSLAERRISKFQVFFRGSCMNHAGYNPLDENTVLEATYLIKKFTGLCKNFTSVTCRMSDINV
jgi:hypothetical protein